ncbi:bactofilin family protein [Xylanibacillus composti]|uniref:bactofilin family protein n=1 Tax=Xylanibacillus composti TaxID=1572762 RepID=UPI001FD46A3D|nr:polymer-forming cytoskeletal protein [Xylanibacillus composti]
MVLGKKNNANPNETDTIIGEGSKIEGKITSKAGLRLDGQVDGDITCAGDVTVGPKGTANSQIRARNVFNAGTIHGGVITDGLLSITESGKLYGNIRAGALSIAQGGLFQGESQMETKKAEAGGSNVKSINEHEKDAAKHEKAAASR